MDSYSYKPGQSIPGTQYRFVRTIGFGAHGSVCVVEHSFLEARAVMKLLHPELATEAGIAQRMTREARTLAKLRHPNIVEVRDGGMTAEMPPRPYFVMESLTGITLRDLVKRMDGKGIGVAAALRIMSGVMEGLHHAHVAGVIHRDIKPDNVFLHRTTTDQTNPKILDFGIAHLLTGERLTGESVLGTPRYAAPEQLLGERVAATSDIYSAGLVLWELITGQLPFAEKRGFEGLLKAHVLEKLPPPSSLTREASPEVDAVIAYLSDREPSRRPPTAYAAAVAIREVQANLASRDHEPSDLEAAEYHTRPTPLENALVEASPGSISLVVDAPKAGPDAVTRPGPPPRPYVPPEDTNTLPMTNRPSALLAAALDRTRELPAEAKAPEPPAPAAEPAPPPTSAPIPPPVTVRVPTFTQRLAARPLLLFLGALAIIAGVGVPIAVAVTKRVVAAHAVPSARPIPPANAGGPSP